MDFQTRILTGVGWIGSPLLGLASSWVLLWCLGLPANCRVLLNPLPRQSMRLFGWQILAYLGLPWLISSHRILFILPAEHYSFYQSNTPYVAVASCCSQLLWITYTMSDFGEVYHFSVTAPVPYVLQGTQCFTPKPNT
jgi:hypothetical protein